MTAPIARGAAQLLRATGAGWRAVITSGTGTTVVGSLELVDGVNRRVSRTVPCRTEAVRLWGPGGQRAVAVWLSTDDGATWKADGAWCWTIGASLPAPVSVIDLRTVVGIPWSQPAAADEMRRAA